MSLAVQGSPEWHKARAGKIKASVCAALEGKHKYMKAADLVRQEVRALAGAESEFKMVPAVAHGQMMEDTARIFLEKQKGYTVEETGLVIHPDHDWLAASPDGLVGLEGCIEIKCPYPQYTKQPYSVFDKAKSVYLWQVYLQMEVLDVDWCDFICYLAKNETHEPQFTIERVNRKEDFLTETISRKYCPHPVKGTISRLDLFRMWWEHIQAEFNDPVSKKIHCDPIEAESADVVTDDDDLNKLTKIQNRIVQVKDRISDELEILDVLTENATQLKKDIADRYDASVSNGKTTVKIITKTPPIDFKKAFEFLGGEDAILNRDESMDSFRRTTGGRQVTILHGE
jgi:putative phage-type endonuclease